MHNHTRERSQHPCCRRVTSLFQTNRRSKLFKFDRNSSTRTKRSDGIKPSEPLSEPRRPRPEQLRRAPTTSTTRLRRNDDRREERRYDNRDHSHGDRPKSSRTEQLHRDQPDVYAKIIFLNNAIRGNPASRDRRSTITVPGIHARGDVN